ncbi:hypothetical protein ACIBFB_25900 [Nocardiopsis sp. NPDC050513]|uniref:hypothetical protein n=1 Tax=Nocardiopsis sp. NPDC050513 TaxID=3364338 RepID=UPI0037B5DF5E
MTEHDVVEADPRPDTDARDDVREDGPGPDAAEPSEEQKTSGEAGPAADTGSFEGEDGLLEGPDAVSDDERDLSADARARRRDELRQRVAGFDASTYIGAVHVHDGRLVRFGGSTGPDQGTPAVGQVSAHQLRALTDSYVSAPVDVHLTHALVTERLVFLNGREYGGRSTSATVALSRWSDLAGTDGGGPRVSILAPDGEFASLTVRLRAGTGHLVDATGEDWSHTLTQAELDGVRSVLDREKSALVVLVDTPVPAPAVTRYLVHHRPPEPERIHHGALESRLADSKAERVLAAVGDHPHLRSWTAEMSTPAEAVALAECLADWWHAGGEGEAPILEHRHRLMCAWARRLLWAAHTSHSPTHQAYVLATAVLDGHAVSTVVRAAERLDRGFRRIEGADGERGREVFDSFLHRIRHVSVEVGDRTAEGTSPRAVARLRHPRLAGALLDVLWSEFDATRDAFVSWLLDLCSDQDARVRISAAQALGRLAGLDLPEIKRRVVVPLAKEVRGRDHQAVSWVLEKAYKDGVREGEVRALLRSWSRSGLWSQVAVALRAYATEIGRERPDEALKGIHEAVLRARARTHRARRGRRPDDGTGGARTRDAGASTGPAARSTRALAKRNAPLAVLAAAALAEIYTGGTDVDRRAVIEELLGLLRLPGETPKEVPETFVRVAAVPSGADTPDARGPTGEPLDRGHDLLDRLAHGVLGPTPTASVAALWATALVDPDLAGAAWERLTRWDESAPVSGPARDLVEDLLSHLGAIRALSARVHLYLAFRDHRGGPGRARGADRTKECT